MSESTGISKEELISKLEELAQISDTALSHVLLQVALLNYIGDKDITEVWWTIHPTVLKVAECEIAV